MFETIGKRILQLTEFDTIQISKNCPRGCRDCSQSPTYNYSIMPLETFERAVEKVLELEGEIKKELFTRYVLTSTDSDPFFHPKLYDILKCFKEMTGKRFYLLTSGWFLHENQNRKSNILTAANVKKWQENAEAIAADPEVIESLTITVKASPTNPQTVEETEDILVNTIRTFRSFPYGKLMLTPQYVPGPLENLKENSIFTASFLQEFVDRILDRVGGGIREKLTGKIFYRPIVGLGGAVHNLGLSPATPFDYRVEAEQPPPPITTPENEIERPFSGMIAINGKLKILEAPRARLYRDISKYHPLGV